MSWHALPPELLLAVAALLPKRDVLALSATASAERALCLPAIFADVALATPAFFPTTYGAYVRSLAISGDTDRIVAVLDACTRLQSLTLTFTAPVDPAKLVPAFTRLHHVHSFRIACGGREDVSPVSERLAVALAASLPSLTHLALSRITRSAIHVDPCDVPCGIPVVTNDVDVPPHPVLGSDLTLPNLLRLPSLRTLEIRDTWVGCDTHIEPTASLDKLVITGSMYGDVASEAQACAAWVHACSPLRYLELGAALAPSTESVACVKHVHINASRTTVDDLPPTLDALKSSGVESISIGCERVEGEKPDEFARECALEDLEDWRTAIDAFLLGRSKDEWSALGRMELSLGQGVGATWDL